MLKIVIMPTLKGKVALTGKADKMTPTESLYIFRAQHQMHLTTPVFWDHPLFLQMK